MMRWKQMILLFTVSVVTTKCASIIGSQSVITIEHFPDIVNESDNNSSQENNEPLTGGNTDLDMEINLNISKQNPYTNKKIINLNDTSMTDQLTTTAAKSSSNTFAVFNAIPSGQPDSNVAYQFHWIPINNSSDRNRVGDGADVNENGVGDAELEGDQEGDGDGNVVGGGNVVGDKNVVGGGNEIGDSEVEGYGGGDEDGVLGGDENGNGGESDNGDINGAETGNGNNGGGEGEDIDGVASGNENGSGGEDEDAGGVGGGSGSENSGGGESDEVVGGGNENGGESGGDNLGEVGSGNGNGGGEECTVDCHVSKISTTSGDVHGYKWRNNDKIIGYIDLPYGKLNTYFERPSRAIQSEKIYDAQEHKKMCPQIKNEEYTGELNCLTLSIFVPTEAENASVLFHIHDPVIGSADPIVYGPEYIVSKGIILVLPNYRIGAPGFLCLLNSTAPGNAGLKDLTVALEWVKDNIQEFGGNPSNIVVSGDGSAGALVGYLALYSPSQNYIKRAIIESGSALSPNALDRNPLNTAQRLAYKLREQNAEKELNNTFEEASLTDIVTAAKDIELNPCVELNSNDLFMNNTPWQILTNNVIDIDFMMGSASFAGTHEAIALPEESIRNLNTDFSQIFPDDLYFHNINDRTRNGQTTKLQYFGENNVTADNLEPLSLCFTDTLYLGPGIRMARSLVASGANVYFYEFDFVGALNKEIERTSRPVSGAIRNDIVGYVFKQVGVLIEENSPEQNMVNLMINLWTSFINNGVPSAPDVNWTEFQNSSESEEAWLRIASEPVMMRGVHVERLRLWTQLYENYYIERSFSITVTPGDYVTYYAVTIFLISFSKFNY